MYKSIQPAILTPIKSSEIVVGKTEVFACGEMEVL